MPEYKDWLRTFYTLDDRGKEVVWGKILDITIKDEVAICFIYFSKNPIGSKIIASPFDRLVNFVADGSLWSTRKKKKK